MLQHFVISDVCLVTVKLIIRRICSQIRTS